MRKKPEIEAEASEGQVAGKVLGARASGSFRGWVALPAVGVVGRPHQPPGPPQLYTEKAKAQEEGDVGSTWSLLLLLQGPLRCQLFPKPPDLASGLAGLQYRELPQTRKILIRWQSLGLALRKPTVQWETHGIQRKECGH